MHEKETTICHDAGGKTQSISVKFSFLGQYIYCTCQN